MYIPDRLVQKINPWGIADTHFFHKNIVDYTRRPNCHSALLAFMWGRFIRKNDFVFHLGDFNFGKRNVTRMLTKALPGQKYLIRGNHDRHSRSFYQRCGWKAVVNQIGFSWKNWEILLTHRPVRNLTFDDRVLNVHGHIHNRSYREPWFLNLSVELNWYAPVRLLSLVDLRIDFLNHIGGLDKAYVF